MASSADPVTPSDDAPPSIDAATDDPPPGSKRTSRPPKLSSPWNRAARLFGVVFFAYLFFLAIEFMGRGMKASFAAPLKSFLNDNAGQINELVSFVIGIFGTAMVQSSSSVTSMCVVLTQEGIMPLVIAAGVVHGANLGTSVTSSIVAFGADVGPSTGNYWRDFKNLLFAPRGNGFKRAVGTAVVHDMFNVIMITAILMLLELPFGFIRSAADASADTIAGAVSSSAWVLDVLKWVSPGTYTKPVSKLVLSMGVPGGVLAFAGLVLIFVALKGFSRRMKESVLEGIDQKDLDAIGARLLGTTTAGTFVRGLILTILVQSSSATTSMVVPLAAIGLFKVKRIFPFILGANIGTTTTAMLAAAGALGQPGFQAGMTIALCHFYLNVLAVAFAFAIPGVGTGVRGAAYWLADRSSQRPVFLLGYLATLIVVVPLVVYLFPMKVAAVFMVAIVLWLLVAPHVYMRKRTRSRLDSLSQQVGRPDMMAEEF